MIFCKSRGNYVILRLYKTEILVNNMGGDIFRKDMECACPTGCIKPAEENKRKVQDKNENSSSRNRICGISGRRMFCRKGL